MSPTGGTATGLIRRYDVGQSGPASPGSWLVTEAPATIRSQVQTTWKQAKRWRHARCGATVATGAVRCDARRGALDVEVAADAAADGFTNFSIRVLQAAASGTRASRRGGSVRGRRRGRRAAERRS